ncbi:MAG TPA: carboxymuconolactone decarboxylase family protein [Ignavibacteriaceae bacterium]|nr:carboxymuconolactone decarboxylase family protein [Ignavibacteriaceae bacterium]
MTEFKIHTVETAPEGSKEILAESIKRSGFIANIHGIMAESPVLLKAYNEIGNIFSESSFSPTERQVVWFTANYDNGCHYCIAAHTAIAKKYKMPDDVIESLRTNNPIADKKLEALRQFTHIIVEKRGYASAEEIEAFLNAGYSKAQLMEVLVGVAHKTLSNYLNHIAGTPLDAEFEKYKWQKELV